MPPRTRFTDETRGAILEFIGEGFSIADAARSADIGPETLRGWLKRGRREEKGEYHDFAAAVDAARQDYVNREQPMDEDELRLAVSRAAKKGSVAAQKLYWEMLNVPDDDAAEESDDPFQELD